uniref:Uncharacterized protein n=1 Tax=Rhizophora mucronata TaxID=61149 RepID=A0A2P2Q8H7_RHIMU
MHTYKFPINSEEKDCAFNYSFCKT